MERNLQILEYDNIQIRHPLTKKLTTLYRVIALYTFRIKEFCIEKHQIGGYVESINNIDMNTLNWVDGKSKIFDNAVIKNGTVTLHNSLVFGNAIVSNSVVANYARIYGNTLVESTLVNDLSEIRGNSKVMTSNLYNSTLIFEDAEVVNTELHTGSNIRGKTIVKDSFLYDTAEISGTAICIGCKLTGSALFKEGEHINETQDRASNLRFIDPINKE